MKPGCPTTAPGSRPLGTTNERAAAAEVRQMFDAIAPRYDLANHVMSFSIDRLWWWRTARRFRHILQRHDAQVLDLCCGTGDMTLAMRRLAPANAKSYFGVDFSHQMLRNGQRKIAGKGLVTVESDALRLPFRDQQFDLVTSAFGFRNLSNYGAGLVEIYRVLRNDREVGILDFGEPSGTFGSIYRFYFRKILPRIGALVSGSSAPYTYLPESVQRFPRPEEMLTMMRTAGFREVQWSPYSFGITGLYWGRK